MKKKLFYLTVLSSILFCLFLMLFQPTLTISIAKEALTLWRERLFPSLFPFLVLGEILILLGVAHYLSSFFQKPFSFLFKTSGAASFLLLMSMISGFPSGPKYIVSLYQKKEFNHEEAGRLLQVAHFSNPLFILGTVFLTLKNQKITYFILFAHYLSNFCILFLTRPKETRNKKRNPSFKEVFLKQTENISDLGLGLLNAVQSGIHTMLFMLGSITFFMLFATFLGKMIPFLSLRIIFTGICDLTSGIFLLDTPALSLFIKGLLATSFLSFGSFSVHLQVFNVLKNTDLSFSTFLKGRWKATLVSGILFTLLCILNGGCY